jgi:hypothetical protein
MVRLSHTFTHSQSPAVYAKKFNMKIHVHSVTLYSVLTTSKPSLWVAIHQGNQAMESLIATVRGKEATVDLKFTMETDNQRPLRFQVFSSAGARLKTLENLLGQAVIDPKSGNHTNLRQTLSLGEGIGTIDVSLESIDMFKPHPKSVFMSGWTPTCDSTSLFLKRHGDNGILNPEGAMSPPLVKIAQ